MICLQSSMNGDGDCQLDGPVCWDQRRVVLRLSKANFDVVAEVMGPTVRDAVQVRPGVDLRVDLVLRESRELREDHGATHLVAGQVVQVREVQVDLRRRPSSWLERGDASRGWCSLHTVLNKSRLN